MTDINRLLNGTAAGQIALNLDKQDEKGQDGKITKSVWDNFWSQHGGDDYKGKNEISVGEDGISVQDAMKAIMTRIFNAAKKNGQNVNDLGKQWLNSIEGHEYLKSGETISAPGQEETPPPDGTTPTPENPPTEGADPVGETPPPDSTKPVKDKKMSGIEKKAGEFKASDIKIKIYRARYPKKPDRTEFDKIMANKKSGEEAANAIRAAHKKINCYDGTAVEYFKNQLRLINKDNVVYVCSQIPNLAEVIDGVDFAGRGLDKKDVFDSVVDPLQQKAKEYGIKFTPIDKSASLVTMQSQITSLSTEIRNIENAKIKQYEGKLKDYNEEVTRLNKLNKEIMPKLKTLAGKCNQALADAANMTPKLKPEKGVDRHGVKWARVTLPDGRKIEAYYEGYEIYSVIVYGDKDEPQSRIYYPEGCYDFYENGKNLAWKPDIELVMNEDQVMQFVKAIFEE